MTILQDLSKRPITSNDYGRIKIN